MLAHAEPLRQSGAAAPIGSTPGCACALMHELFCRGANMYRLTGYVAIAAIVSGCATSTTPSYPDPSTQDTTSLCRTYVTHPDLAYRQRVGAVLSKRAASADKCTRLVASDDALAAGIAVAAAAGAAGAVAANNGYGGGGYYGPSAYGTAWDQFFNEYRQLTWRCRDRGNGQFVFDHYCAGKPMIDSTWPGW